MYKLWFIYTMEYYPLVKMNELDLCSSTWIHLMYIILSGKKQVGKGYIQCDVFI